MASSYEEKTQQYVTSQWTNGCPMCGNRSWGVGEPYELSAFSAQGNGMSRAVMPVIPVVCSACSYLGLIAALPSGLMNA